MSNLEKTGQTKGTSCYGALTNRRRISTDLMERISRQSCGQPHILAAAASIRKGPRRRFHYLLWSLVRRWSVCCHLSPPGCPRQLGEDPRWRDRPPTHSVPTHSAGTQAKGRNARRDRIAVVSRPTVSHRHSSHCEAIVSCPAAMLAWSSCVPHNSQCVDALRMAENGPSITSKRTRRWSSGDLLSVYRRAILGAD
jgi:hypothetical protein